MKPASEGIVELPAVCPHAGARGFTACSSKKKGEDNLRTEKALCTQERARSQILPCPLLKLKTYYGSSPRIQFSSPHPYTEQTVLLFQ